MALGAVDIASGLAVRHVSESEQPEASSGGGYLGVCWYIVEHVLGPRFEGARVRVSAVIEIESDHSPTVVDNQTNTVRIGTGLVVIGDGVGK
jgi:hypothetical protein